MLPVSVTAIILRIIFKLKLADIVINVTAGGPGGATDTVSSFIYREYRDRSNVGYGTMLADVLSRASSSSSSRVAAARCASRWMQQGHAEHDAGRESAVASTDTAPARRSRSRAAREASRPRR